MRAILRQPLLQFFALGLAIFAFNAWFDDAPAPQDKPVIIVSTQDAAWLAEQYKSTWRRAPTESELNGLMADFVREEIYVREALALGLDQGDAIVRRRLRQKMEFLTEAGAEAAVPTDDILQAHLEQNPGRFSTAPRVAFQQIPLRENTPAYVEDLLQQLESGADPQSFASPSLLPDMIPPSPPQAVDGIFGTTFFARVSALPQGQWAGPVASGFGMHLVRVEDYQPETLPKLADVRDRVELDWRANMATELRQRRFEELKSQYEIEQPDAADVLSP